LCSDEGTAYLKCIAKERRREIAITRFVNGISSHGTGAVIDDDTRNGYLLTRGNVGVGGDVDMTELMERYAEIQLKSNGHRDACAFLPVSRPLEQLTAFLETATSRAVTSSRDALAKRRYARIAMKVGRSVALRRHLRRGVTLLEHGDLHLGNVVRDPSLRLRIIDWADATWAPVGASLPYLPLGPRVLGRSLHRSGVTDYVDCYIDLLSEGLQIRRSSISKILISGAISSVVSVANEMGASDWRAYRYRRFAKKLLIACYETTASLARSPDLAR